jgi:hypothetical protein
MKLMFACFDFFLWFQLFFDTFIFYLHTMSYKPKLIHLGWPYTLTLTLSVNNFP